MNKPILTVLNYSGGTQSSAILWMVLRGDIPRPDSFLVLNADPGMENSKTYEYNKEMFKHCNDAGIEALTVPGPNLYSDLVTLKKSNKNRLDNPPYWVDKGEGKKGRLVQKCTYTYKIAPMDRFIRIFLEERFGISRKTKRLGENIVQKWIGFTFDEVHRIKPSKQKYIEFSYPLIDLEMNREDVDAYFKKNGLVKPPRSVCNACFANGLETFKEMYLNRPEDWKQAVKVDKNVRDLTQIGVDLPTYVSNTLIPLDTLAEMDFDLSQEREDADDYSCDSGYCFV